MTAEVNGGPYVFENVSVPAEDALSGTQVDEPEWKVTVK